MDKPANTNNCKADACLGNRREWLQPPVPSPIPERADWAMVDAGRLVAWLRSRQEEANAKAKTETSRNKPFHLGKWSAFFEVEEYLRPKTQTDPPHCDGDAHHPNEPYDEEVYTPNPNNPEVNYGDGEAMEIKGLEL